MSWGAIKEKRERYILFPIYMTMTVYILLYFILLKLCQKLIFNVSYWSYDKS